MGSTRRLCGGDTGDAGRWRIGFCDGQDWKQTQKPGNKWYLQVGCQEEEQELWGSEEGREWRGCGLRTDRLGDFPVKGNNQRLAQQGGCLCGERQLRVPWTPDLAHFPGRG